MRLAHRLFILFAAGHIALVLALLFLPFLEPVAGLGGVTLYLPLVLFKSLGLPVFGHAESGGWSHPSGLGMVLVTAFWAVVWLLTGYAAEFVARHRRPT